MPVDLSIVVVNHNHEQFLEKCFCSILEHQGNIKIEMILVDNVNSSRVNNLIATRFPDVQVIPNKTPVGFAANCNLGFKNSRGRNVLFLNPDIEIIKGSLEDLLGKMEQIPNVGVVCAELLNPDLTPQYSIRQFPTLTAIFFRGFKLGKLFPNATIYKNYLMADIDRSQTFEIDWGLGAFLMFKRKRYEEMGMMDERFSMYYEDVDLCYRLKMAGYKNFFMPDLQVIHDYQRDSAKKLFSKLKFQHIKSILYFFWKHKFTSVPS